MKLVVEGVMNGNLPWPLIFAGACIGLAVEVLGIPILPFAVGLYLPIHLSAGIMVGGLVRLFTEKRKKSTEAEKKEQVDRGILYTSGLIAGEGLVGVLLAILALVKIRGNTIGDIINLSETISLGQIGSIVFFALLVFTLLKYTILYKDKDKEKSDA